MKKIIGVDCDEVLFPLKQPLYDFINELKGVNLKWRSSNYDFGIELGLSYEERVGLYNTFVWANKLEEIKPYPNAFEGMKELKKYFDLVLITSRQNFVREKTEKSLEKYFPKIFSYIEIGNHHNLFEKNNSRTKLEMCRLRNVDLLIEDQTKYAEELNGEIPMILFDQPWNQGFKRKNVYRAKDWEEVVKMTKEILK